MLSSGSRITIVLLVALVVGTAGYWIFLADPGPDPLAGVLDLPEDEEFNGAPSNDDGRDAIALVDGRDAAGDGDFGGVLPLDGPEGDGWLDGDVDEPVPATDEHAWPTDDDPTAEDRIVRPWDTMRRIASGGPVRLNGDGGENRNGNRNGNGDRIGRPSLGDDFRDPDAGKEPAPSVEDSVESEPQESDRRSDPVEPVERPQGSLNVPANTTANGRWGEHVVAMGDTVVAIAEVWFGEPGQWDLILRANPGVDPRRLSIGQTLRLPPRDWRPSGEPARGAGAPAPTGVGAARDTHVVRPTETLSVIARQHYGRGDLWRLIYDANRRTIGPDPGRLSVGMTLRIPPAPRDD